MVTAPWRDRPPRPPSRSVELGLLTDAQLSSLAPRPIAAGSWWSAGSWPTAGRTVPAVAGEGARLARHVLHHATTVVTFEDEGGRGGFVATEGMVLIDRIEAGRHDVTVVNMPVGVFVLSVLLDPRDQAQHRLRRRDRPRFVPHDRLADEVPSVSSRTSAVRLVRVTTEPTPTETVLTVVTTPDGAMAWRALPAGGAVLTALDRDGVVAASIALLTGAPTVAAA